MMDSKPIIVYTDGACSPNPGRGGWAAIIDDGQRQTALIGNALHTNNNRMELMAVVQALKHIVYTRRRVIVHSDSAYVVNPFLYHRYNSPLQKGKNRDLWDPLIKMFQEMNVEFVKVKGHSGIYLNDECDGLAKYAVQLLDNFPQTKHQINHRIFLYPQPTPSLGVYDEYLEATS